MYKTQLDGQTAEGGGFFQIEQVVIKFNDVSEAAHYYYHFHSHGHCYGH